MLKKTSKQQSRAAARRRAALARRRAERAALALQRAESAAHARAAKLGIVPDLPPVAARDAIGARLISKHEVLDRVGLSYPTIWALMIKGRFPRSVALGSKSAWVASEVEAWIASLPRRRLKGDDQQQQPAAAR